MRKWLSLIVSIILFAAALLVHRNVVSDALNTLPEAALAGASPPISVEAFSELDGITALEPVLTGSGSIQSHAVTAYYTTAGAPRSFWPYHEIRRL
jgi:hypothetical protein